jgi:amino acid adenylation domain-containing protein
LYPGGEVDTASARMPSEAAAARPAVDSRPFHLSRTQEGLWFLQQLYPDVPLVVAQYIEMRGKVDYSLLNRVSIDASWELQSPGIRLIEIGGQPFQLADATIEDALSYIDFRDRANPVRDAQQWMVEQYCRPLDVLTDRLIAATLLQLDTEHFYLFSWSHHLVLDGHGAMALMNRAAELYTHAMHGTDAPAFRGLPVQDLYLLDATYRDSSRFAIDRDHWARRLAKVSKPVSLARGTAHASMPARLVTGALSPEVVAGIAEVTERAKSYDVPVIAAAFAAFLSQMTGRGDVVLSLPISARTTASSRRSGGTVSNIVPIRVRIDPTLRFEQVVRNVQLELTGALRHQRYRYEDMRRELAATGSVGTGFGPTVNVMMFHEEIVFGDVVGEFRVLTTGPIEDLAVNIYPGVKGSSTRIDFEANPSLYTADEIRSHHARFLAYLARVVVAAPAMRLGNIDLFDDREAVAHLSDSPSPAGEQKTLIDWFEHAAQDPEWEFAALAERSRALGRELIARGVGPEDRIAVIADPRSDTWVVGCWAVAASGAAIVPIDLTDSDDRIAFVIADANVRAAIASDPSSVPAGIDRIIAGDRVGRADVIGDAERTTSLHVDQVAWVRYPHDDGSLAGLGLTHRSIAETPELVAVFGGVELPHADPDSRGMIFNRWLRPLPPGVIGDLYVPVTECVRGDLDRPGRTSMHFVANPCGPGRMQRTGKCAKWSEEHAVEIVDSLEETNDEALTRKPRSPGSRALLSPDRPRTALLSPMIAEVRSRVQADVHRRIWRVASDHHATLGVILHAALSVTLARMTMGTDIRVATRLAGRDTVLAVTIDPESPLTDLINSARSAQAAALDRCDSSPLRLVSGDPRPQIAFTSGSADGQFDLADFDLVLAFTEDWDGCEPMGIELAATFPHELFDTETVRSYTTVLGEVLGSVGDWVNSTMADISLSSSAALESAEPPPDSQSLQEIFAATVRTHADSDALSNGVIDLTYDELDRISNALARELVDRGAVPGAIVALALPRSVEFVVALWAVVKTGAAFLPLDPTQPIDRLSILIADSGTTLVVGDPGQFWDAVPVDSARWAIDKDRSTPPVRVATHPLDIAYIVYTSGSTGVPKGVMVPHSGLASLTCEGVTRYRVDSKSRVLHGYNPVFDAALLEMLLAFGSGACLVVASPDVFAGEELFNLLREQRISHHLSTPSVLSSINSEGLPDLSVVAVGGEPLTTELASRWTEPIHKGSGRSERRLMLNAYGPTESTVVATLAAVDHFVTIGAPIRGTSAWVLDNRFRPVPIGAVGELYLSGAGLAHGYIRSAGLTSQRFLANPFRPGRMYRTGDLVSRRSDGTLDFISRADHQVKIRGIRVELGEIESVVRTHNSVSDAVAAVYDDATAGSRLVVYVVTDGTDWLSTEEHLRQLMIARLPSYMVPDSYVFLSELPINATGKLDRAALPRPAFRSKSVFRAPDGQTEKLVADIVAELLDTDRIGADDSFFDLGGNSLLAARVVSRVNEVLDSSVNVRDFFDSPTVAGLARRVDDINESNIALPRLRAYERPEVVPLAPAQERIWYADKGVSTGDWNIPSALRIRGPISVDILQRALDDVVERHEPLRTIYPDSDAGPSQVIAAPEVALTHIDLVTIDESDLTGPLQDFLWSPFDIRNDRPLRARLFSLGIDDHVFAIVVHHMSADGFSMIPLSRDIVSAYLARAQGIAPAWKPLAVSYADYALWKRETLGDLEDMNSEAFRQLRYWTTTLNDRPRPMRFPTARPRRRQRSSAGASIPVHIDTSTHFALTKVARICGASLFMVMQAAWALFLSSLSECSDVVFATSIAGRDDPALDDLVGSFADDVLLRVMVDPKLSFAELVSRVRLAALGAYAHPDISNPRLQRHFGARGPFFQVQFIMQPGRPPVDLDMDGLRITSHPIAIDVSKHEFEFALSDHYDASGAPAGIAGWCVYSVDLFDMATAHRIVDTFLDVLVAISRGTPYVAAESLMRTASRAALFDGTA